MSAAGSRSCAVLLFGILLCSAVVCVECSGQATAVSGEKSAGSTARTNPVVYVSGTGETFSTE